MLATVLWSASVADAQPTPASFAYVLQADSFAKTKPAAVERLVGCGRDWIVLDAAFGGDAPWERADLDAIRRGQPGRKVIACLSIGEAEDYRPYWRKEWGYEEKTNRRRARVARHGEPGVEGQLSREVLAHGLAEADAGGGGRCDGARL